MTFYIYQGRPTIDKDPAARLSYAWDWAAWLTATADTIANVTVTAPGVTVTSVGHAAGVVTATLSGGTKGDMVAAVCTITTSGGLIEKRTFYLRIVAR